MAKLERPPSDCKPVQVSLLITQWALDCWTAVLTAVLTCSKLQTSRGVLSSLQCSSTSCTTLANCEAAAGRKAGPELTHMHGIKHTFSHTVLKQSRRP